MAKNQTKRLLTTLAVVSGLLIAASPRDALAQSRDPAAAQALFDQARQLVKQGRYADACPKLEESNRLDPGIGTQFHLADCYELSGRIASAWATFLDVASQARAANQAEREGAAQKRATKLEARLPRLTLNVPDGSKTPGLEVRRNGLLIGAAQWGTPMPVDPGEVEIVATAPGRRPLTQSLRLEEGKTASFDLPALLAASDSGPDQTLTPHDAAEPAPDSPAENANAPAAAATESGGSMPLVITLAAVGVVGLGVGATFAMMANSTNDDSAQYCEPEDPNACSQRGVDMRDDARGKGNVATIGFVAGGAALAGAGVVWLLDGGTKPKESGAGPRLRSSAAIGPGHATLHVGGSF
jgi:hypothetical protein